MSQNTRELKKLQKEWYNKLKNIGYKDIEKNDDLIEYSTSAAIKRYGDPKHKQKELYFRMVGWFLYDYKFPAAIEKKIWALRAQGCSIRTIYRTLKPTPDFICIDNIKKILKKLEAKMKAKYESTDIE